MAYRGLQGAADTDPEDRACEVTLADLDACEDGPMLTIAQVAELVQLSDDTVRELVKAGDIRGVQLGRVWRVVWSSFRAYLVKCRVLPLPEVERRRRPRIPLPPNVPRT